MSERLTHKRCSGIATGYWSPAKKQELVDRLARFEDLAGLPERICDKYCRYPFECREGELEKKCQSCPMNGLADLLE